MFCRFCGKEINDVKYCPHCGKSVDKASFDADAIKKAAANIKKAALTVGYNKLFMLTAIIGTVINFIVRICCNEITVVRVALVQDDYYRLSGLGRVWTVVIILIQILIYAALWFDAKKGRSRSSDFVSDNTETGLTESEREPDASCVNSAVIEKKAYIIAGILLLIQIAVMLLSIPAPY